MCDACWEVWWSLPTGRPDVRLWAKRCAPCAHYRDDCAEPPVCACRCHGAVLPPGTAVQEQRLDAAAGALVGDEDAGAAVALGDSQRDHEVGGAERGAPE